MYICKKTFLSSFGITKQKTIWKEKTGTHSWIDDGWCEILLVYADVHCSLSLSLSMSVCVCLCVQVWRCLNKMPMLLPYQDRNWLPAAANQVDTSREKTQISIAQIGECSHLEMIYTSFCPTPFHQVLLTMRSVADSSAAFHQPPAMQHHLI